MSPKTSMSRKRLTDEELVERIKNGDRESLAILIEAYFPKVYNRVQSLVPESSAEDVTQDIFLSLLDSINSFQVKSAFATWFHRIMMNRVADYHRKRSRRKNQLIEDYEPRTINPWKAKDDELMAKQILLELPERHRAILLLRFSEGLYFAEIAEKLGLTYEATRSRYRRAIAAFREKIRADLE